MSICLAAQSSSAIDKVDIRSDKLTIDRHKNVSTFEGNVILEFNDMLLKTQRIKIIYKVASKTNRTNTKDTLDKIIITDPFIAVRGNIKNIQPENISNLIPKVGIELIHAQYAEYKAADKTLVIKGKVKVQKDKHTIICDELLYYTDIIKIY